MGNAEVSSGASCEQTGASCEQTGTPCDTQGLQSEPVTAVSFSINGQSVLLENPSPYLSLNEWIRAQQGLSGTKKMCGEGGCGCCVVTVRKADPSTGKESTISINSVRRNTSLHSRGFLTFGTCISPLPSVCSLPTPEATLKKGGGVGGGGLKGRCCRRRG